MKSFELRKAFLNFFKEKGHEIVASSSLLPADPTSLFTSAGMQQFVPYLSGEREPPYSRACSVQKCLRVNDIDGVGDDYHNTFFEMFGNWSFGDYFKEEAIEMAMEFLVEVLKLKQENIWITVFEGEAGIPKDEDSIAFWQKQGIAREKIFECGMEDNFWGPVTASGPCGPCSEIFYDRGKELGCGKKSCGPNCKHCQRFIEIWNLVFMEYNKNTAGDYEKLPKQNVDTGMGDRTLLVLQGVRSEYETDMFWPIIRAVERLAGRKYEDEKNQKSFRIIADHLRASCFIISEGVFPSNLDRGYVLRMLIRRLIRHAKLLGLPEKWYAAPINEVIKIYGESYPELRGCQAGIITVMEKEEEKFEKCLQQGLKEFEKMIGPEKKEISGQEAFDLYQNYGFPVELTRELAKEKKTRVDEPGFLKALEAHKELSRAGAKRKFGGVGIDQLEKGEERIKATRLHTATHLLHAALRKVLGKEVQQMGSDITPERLRFDFSYSKKPTAEQLKEIEKLINDNIRKGLVIKKEEMPFQQAVDCGALAFFKEKYPRDVFVYIIEDKKGKIISREVCYGPHADDGDDFGVFKIIKEESVGVGLRRIKATLA